MSSITWIGSKKCDFCGTEIDSILYDAKTIHGPWAVMCEDCYKKYGFAILGKGLGQKYEKMEDGKFHKIEG